MLLGSADPRALAERAPTLERFDTPPLELARVEVLQLAAEIRAGGVERLYPPALHPTLPPLAVWQVVAAWKARSAASRWQFFGCRAAAGCDPVGSWSPA
jgi:hypothetical protein